MEENEILFHYSQFIFAQKIKSSKPMPEKQSSLFAVYYLSFVHASKRPSKQGVGRMSWREGRDLLGSHSAGAEPRRLTGAAEMLHRVR